jgi:hypothetical protein
VLLLEASIRAATLSDSEFLKISINTVNILAIIIDIYIYIYIYIYFHSFAGNNYKEITFVSVFMCFYCNFLVYFMK